MARSRRIIKPAPVFYALPDKVVAYANTLARPFPHGLPAEILVTRREMFYRLVAAALEVEFPEQYWQGAQELPERSPGLVHVSMDLL
jgi:hypothetical protein